MEPTTAASPEAGFGAAIEDVSATTREYVWHEHGILFTAAIVLCISLSAVISFVVYEAYVLDPRDFDGRSLILPILPLLALSSLYRYYRTKIQHLFMQQIASAIGFDYREAAPFETVSGTFFSLGTSTRLSDVLSGTYQGRPVRIYTYQYTIGSGRDRHTYIYTVFEMDCGVPLPHVVMNVPTFLAPPDMEPVELEGGFNRHFKLYVSKGQQVEVREIFQPDMMQDLVSSFTSFGMEVSGTKIYLMRKSPMTKKQTFLDMIALIDQLLGTLIPALRAMASSETQKPQAQTQV